MALGMLDLTQRAELESRRTRVLKRRRIITLASLGIAVLLVVFLGLYQFTDVIFRLSPNLESSSPSGDWAMFRHDLGHTGRTGPATDLPRGNLKWTFTTGSAVHSSPAVVNGIVYIGSRDGNLYALDAATGAQRWAFKTGSWVESSPVVVNGVVYFGSNDGHLYAADAATGRKLWAFDSHYSVRSAPAVADGVVYIGSDDYAVYGIDAATGRQLWSFETGNLVPSSPIVTGGVVVIGSMDGICYTLNAKNGRVRLEFDTRSPVVSSPAVKGGVAYFANSGGNVYAIDIQAKNWPFENKLKVFWQALYIYGAAPKPPDPSGFIWTLHLKDKSNSSPAWLGDTLYLGSGNKLMAIDLNTRETKWTFASGGLIVSSPAVTDTVVYVGSQDGRLYAVDRATGARLWDGLTGDSVTSSPAVAGGMVFVGSEDGKVYAFD